jgi:hypothetical protein
MVQIFRFDTHASRTFVGLTLAETRELERLERIIPSLSDWNAYTMQPVSDTEKRWAYLSQKRVDAITRRAKTD